MSAWYCAGKLGKGELLVRKGAAGMFIMLARLVKAKQGRPFREITGVERSTILKDTYNGLLGVMAALRVTQSEQSALSV